MRVNHALRNTVFKSVLLDQPVLPAVCPGKISRNAPGRWAQKEIIMTIARRRKYILRPYVMSRGVYSDGNREKMLTDVCEGWVATYIIIIYIFKFKKTKNYYASAANITIVGYVTVIACYTVLYCIRFIFYRLCSVFVL